MPARAASAAGLAATCAPAPASDCAFCAERFQTTRSFPALTRFSAIGSPIGKIKIDELITTHYALDDFQRALDDLLLRTDDLAGAVWIPDDGKANPTDLTQSLAKGAIGDKHAHAGIADHERGTDDGMVGRHADRLPRRARHLRLAQYT